MNIAHVIASIGKASFGLGPVALNLASRQMQLGTDADIWCMDGSDDIAWACQISGLPTERIHIFKNTFLKPIFWSQGLKRHAINRSRELSIIHQHGIWMGYSHVISKLRREYGIPSVVAPHGSLESWALKKRSYWKKRIALAAYERKNLDAASCLHACSEQEVTSFRNFGLKNPVAVIPNGISEGWLQSSGDKTAFCQNYGIDGSKRIMLFLSRISPKKGLPLLLSVLSRLRPCLRDWHLVIAGKDEFGHQAELVEQLSRKKLEDLITFVGPLYSAAKCDAFHSAELFVLPTMSENFAIVVAEALGAGVPVITTKEAPWHELPVHGCGWWVDSEADALADALKDAIQSSPKRLAQMGMRGKELVAANYTWDKVAGMSLDLYQWLLGNRERPDFVVMN